MATATNYFSVPTTSHDIYANYFLNQNYPGSIDGTFGMGFQETLYPPNDMQAPSTFSYYPNNLPYFEPPQVGLAPTFPQLQTHPQFTTAIGSGSPETSQSALTHSPAPVRKKIRKAKPIPKEKGKQTTRTATQSAKRELLISNPKRKRGPKKRAPGTSFSEMLDGLEHNVRKAMKEDYKGCCEQAVDCVRRALGSLFEDGLLLTNHRDEEGESKGSGGAIVDEPPTTSEPGVKQESAHVDTLQVTSNESQQSNVPQAGGIVDPTAPAPATSKPLFEPESVDVSEWDFDTLLHHAAPLPTTSEPTPESLDEWFFDTWVHYGTPSPTTSEPVFERDTGSTEQVFDNMIAPALQG